MSLAAVACCRAGPRLFIIGVLTAFSVSCDRWDVALFLVGAILSEPSMMRRAKADTAASTIVLGVNDSGKYDVDARMAVPRKPRARGRLMIGLGVLAMALLGLYLLSYPAKLVGLHMLHRRGVRCIFGYGRTTTQYA